MIHPRSGRVYYNAKEGHREALRTVRAGTTAPRTTGPDAGKLPPAATSARRPLRCTSVSVLPALTYVRGTGPPDHASMAALTKDHRAALAALSGTRRELAEAAVALYPACPPEAVIAAVGEWLSRRRVPASVAWPLRYLRASQRTLDPIVARHADLR
jgi:hypothetical protein